MTGSWRKNKKGNIGNQNSLEVREKVSETKKRLFKLGIIKSWNKLPRIKKCCVICNEDIIVPENSKQRFCSVNCTNIWQRTEREFKKEWAIKSVAGQKKYYSKHSTWNKNLTKETHLSIKRQSIKVKKWMKESGTGKKFSIAGRKKQIEKGYKTRPERIMEEHLVKNNIPYVWQQRVGKYWADFYLPHYNIIIECDGNYWHNYPNGTDNDRKKDKYYTDNGLICMRFWESEILEHMGDCMKSLNDIIWLKDY